MHSQFYFCFGQSQPWQKKIIFISNESNELSLAQKIGIFGSGLVGALAYTFSDSFWFSATEGEVYAMSSTFTAITFWAILKWESEADDKYAARWIILIAYLIGLSIGVHLLNLLAIPALVFIYYFKKYEASKLGIIKVFFASSCNYWRYSRSHNSTSSEFCKGI